ncbi:hypothetical protein [Lactobacillus taiwanensis]|jgi:hypothetical protein|uniref:hypothetical protein n=1 Tax=Lactobacillus taiwanensis TaxID=508451 RepID=UPI00214BD259|nr:hypothetical protein [Lactobacillus taiwanensis]MCR1903916.1 hypothetical protein [Lactobacillus taiwanensis]
MNNKLATEYIEVFSNENEMQNFLHTTQNISTFFENIRYKLPFSNYRRTAFISAIIGDFLWDMIDEVSNNLKNELNYYWDGNVNSYLEELKSYSNEATNIITNLFIFYDETFCNENKNISFDEIDDVSDEYYRSYFAGNISEIANKEAKIANLSQEKKNILKQYLKACDLEFDF